MHGHPQDFSVPLRAMDEYGGQMVSQVNHRKKNSAVYRFSICVQASLSLIKTGNHQISEEQTRIEFMDRGAWQTVIHGVAKSQTLLSD